MTFNTFFSTPTTTLSSAMICDLSPLGLMQVQGDDAENFLQGQLTNDLTAVTNSHSQMSAYCTHKGRIQANFRLCRFNDTYLLQMPLEILTPFIKRLSMFVMRAKVTITDASQALTRIGFAGDAIAPLLQQQLGDLPQQAGDVVSQPDLTLMRLPGDTPRFELICLEDKALELLQALKDDLHSVTQDIWQLLDIRAGIPTVIQDTFEKFVPQMINMHLIDGISFTKGCYIGQEVVARLKYLGKTKRQMYLAKTNGDDFPKAGDKLYSTGSSSGQGAGNVVNVIRSPDGGCDMLVVSEIAGVARNDVQLINADGDSLQFLSLPYSFED